MNHILAFSLLTLSAIFYALHQSAEAVLQTRQSSTNNEDWSQKAVDNDVDTCAVTGFETDSWWVVDLGQVTEVRGARVIGETNEIHVRVGNLSDSLGVRRGFDFNDWCALQLSVTSASNISCARPIHGRYVSIQSVNPAISERMSLCDVTIY